MISINRFKTHLKISVTNAHDSNHEGAQWHSWIINIVVMIVLCDIVEWNGRIGLLVVVSIDCCYVLLCVGVVRFFCGFFRKKRHAKTRKPPQKHHNIMHPSARGKTEPHSDDVIWQRTVNPHIATSITPLLAWDSRHRSRKSATPHRDNHTQHNTINSIPCNPIPTKLTILLTPIPKPPHQLHLNAPLYNTGHIS